MGLQHGDRFGRLTVIRKDGVHKKPCGTTQSKYLCKCDCGKEISVLMQNLKNGNTKSCGCLSAEIKKSKLLPNNKGVINHIILQYKRHARNRNLVWELSYEQVEKIINSPCYYCGTEKSNHKVTKNCKAGFDHNGIDRVDSAKGYLPDNVVPCCKTCNKAKGNMTQQDFIMWAQKVAKHTKAMAEQWGGDLIGNA
jgi:hypothetical protein